MRKVKLKFTLKAKILPDGQSAGISCSCNDLGGPVITFFSSDEAQKRTIERIHRHIKTKRHQTFEFQKIETEKTKAREKASMQQKLAIESKAKYFTTRKKV